MPEKKNATGPSKRSKPAREETPKRSGKREVPPESAEDFEHVLRRLISTRDRQQAER